MASVGLLPKIAPPMPPAARFPSNTEGAPPSSITAEPLRRNAPP